MSPQGEREMKLLKILYEGLAYGFPLERERQILIQKGKAEEMITVRYLCFPAIFDPRK
jgi:hypothetical protein